MPSLESGPVSVDLGETADSPKDRWSLVDTISDLPIDDIPTSPDGAGEVILRSESSSPQIIGTFGSNYRLGDFGLISPLLSPIPVPAYSVETDGGVGLNGFSTNASTDCINADADADADTNIPDAADIEVSDNAENDQEMIDSDEEVDSEELLRKNTLKTIGNNALALLRLTAAKRQMSNYRPSNEFERLFDFSFGDLCDHDPSAALFILADLVGLKPTILEKNMHEFLGSVEWYYLNQPSLSLGQVFAIVRPFWLCFNSPFFDSAKGMALGDRCYERWLVSRSPENVLSVDHDGQQVIKNPYIVTPRSIWDLKANRVINFGHLMASHNVSLWTASAMTNQHLNITWPSYWAVSHSWTDDMVFLSTVINNFQWPVPVPIGVDLADIRNELLSFGAEYVWIDILCLQQQSSDPQQELERREQWKIDVPTIGNVYLHAQKVVRYFNGLGRKFTIQNWNNPRHWLQRAWTLQEIREEKDTFTGGISQGVVLLNSKGQVDGEEMTLRKLMKPIVQLANEAARGHGCALYRLVREMQKRVSTNPVDKVAGLFYLLRNPVLIAYNERETTETAWLRCFRYLRFDKKLEILFEFPHRNSLIDSWVPQWSQLMEWPKRDDTLDYQLPIDPIELELRLHIGDFPDCQISDMVTAVINSSKPCYIRGVNFSPTAPPDILFMRATIVSNVHLVVSTTQPGEYKITMPQRAVIGPFIPQTQFAFFSCYPDQQVNIPEGIYCLATHTTEINENCTWLVCKQQTKGALPIENEIFGHSPLEGYIPLDTIPVLKKLACLRTDDINVLLTLHEIINRITMYCAFV